MLWLITFKKWLSVFIWLLILYPWAERYLEIISYSIGLLIEMLMRWERFEILVQGFRRKTTQHMLWNIETIALFTLAWYQVIWRLVYMRLNDMRWNHPIAFIDTTIFAALIKFPVYCFIYAYFDVNVSNSNFCILSILFHKHTPNSN